MNKYLSIFKMGFKENSKTTVNTFVGMVSFSVIIFAFVQLWTFIYGPSGTGQELINGYTLNMMLFYLICAEIIVIANKGRYVLLGTSHDIRTGRIAYLLNKPFNYYIYTIVYGYTEMAFKLLFMIPLGLLLGFLFTGLSISAIGAAPAILTLFLSGIITSSVYGVLGLLAFWMEDSLPFGWIYEKFIFIFGLMFPPEFFTRAIQPFILYSPVYATVSGPSRLFANFSWAEFGRVVASQFAWIIIFIVLGLLIYKRGTRKVNINGG